MFFRCWPRLAPSSRNKAKRLRTVGVLRWLRATIGSIRAVDAKLAVFFFMGAINWMTQWFRPDGDMSGEGIASVFDYGEFPALLEHLMNNFEPANCK